MINIGRTGAEIYRIAKGPLKAPLLETGESTHTRKKKNRRRRRRVNDVK